MEKSGRSFTGKKIFYDTLDSTNNRLQDLINEANPAEGTVVYTNFQTGGRGHMGNTWQSERGKNLLFSILLFPVFLHISNQFELSKIISLALADVTEKLCNDIRIKWPNDILAGGKKMGGILIENVVTENKITRCIAGIGLNVNQEHFPGDLPNPTSLLLETGCQFDMTELLDQITARIEYWYNILCRGEFKIIDREYLNHLYGIHEIREFTRDDEKFMAKIAGIDQTGELILEMEDGSKNKFGFKEVIYK